MGAYAPERAVGESAVGHGARAWHLNRRDADLAVRVRE